MFFKYFGLVAVFIVWVFVISPAVMAKINLKKDTITSATYNKKYSSLINLGLLLGGVSQIIFSIYLAQKFKISVFNPGVIFYISTAVATILVSIFSENKFMRLHILLVKYFFVIHPLSIFLLGVLGESNTFVNAICLIVPLLYFGGIIMGLKLNNKLNAISEIWAFAVLSVWSLMITFL